jgi:NtrC-family two-component system response regulator AlgB
MSMVKTLRGIVPGVPSVIDLRDKVRGWLRREPKVVVPRAILIVDSNAPNRQSTTRLVESLGYQAVQTSSIAAAIERVKGDDPIDFVLLGFELEDANGLEALSKLRKVDPGLAIIMLAADLWDTRVAEAMRCGAVAYLARPFGPAELRELLGRR